MSSNSKLKTQNSKLYYAVGGGLGHLTRARAVLHTLGVAGDVTLLTASRAALDTRINAGFDVCLIPQHLADDCAAYQGWLRETISSIAPRTIYIDTFPGGIIGELCDFAFPGDSELIHIARLLRWDRYRNVLSGSAPRFVRSHITEPLLPEHEAFVRAHSAEISPLELTDPPAPLDADRACELASSLRSGREQLWLVVHSGSDDEVSELLDYARERAAMEGCSPTIALIAPVRPVWLPSDVGHSDLYPAAPLFPFADRAITACGFNAMRQLEPFREKHRFMPFPRRYDDQFLRGSRRLEVKG